MNTYFNNLGECPPITKESFEKFIDEFDFPEIINCDVEIALNEQLNRILDNERRRISKPFFTNK